MPKMPLSAALRAGRNRTTHAYDSVKMVLQIEGALPDNLDDPRSFGSGQWQALAYPEEALSRLHPWLCETLLCPWCAEKLVGGEIVRHPIEQHGDEIDLQEECEWLAEMEAAAPEARKPAFAVYLRDDAERQRVFFAARANKTTVNGFIGAAVRFALEYGFSMKPKCEIVQ